jgi:hypothetical protein
MARSRYGLAAYCTVELERIAFARWAFRFSDIPLVLVPQGLALPASISGTAVVESH